MNIRRNGAVCKLCGRKSAQPSHMTRSYGRGTGEYLIRHIPVVRCSHCGGTYLTADTLHEIERIRANHGTLAKKRRIAVVDFPRQPRRRAG